MKQLLLLGLLGLTPLGAVTAAWSQGDVTTAPGLAPPVDDGLRPVMTTSEFVVGPNRLAFGLLKAGQLVHDADVVVRAYKLGNQQAQLQGQTKAVYAELGLVEQGRRLHVHPDGTRHVHRKATEVQGIYVMQVTFDRPGTWGFEILAKQGGGPAEVSRFSVDVLEASRTPIPGTPAPRSRNLIASDVRDLRKIDTSDPPDPRLHQVRISDAIAWGKPQLIVFATPRLCTSRLCAPMVDIVRTLVPAYGDRVVFTHQEIWQDAAAREFTPTVAEWGLQTEPWIFVVDSKGIVRAKFEGLATAREIETALRQVLQK